MKLSTLAMITITITASNNDDSNSGNNIAYYKLASDGVCQS